MPLRFLTAGESHGPSLTSILDGMPAGLRLTPDVIDRELARRQQGYGSGGRMKIEKDTVHILGGVMAGETTGGPIALLVENADHVKWKGKPIEPMTAPRPGHADLTGAVKYGYRDLRPALERASARETAIRVASGAVCKHFLAQFGILVGGYVASIGEVQADFGDMPYEQRFLLAEESDIRCPVEEPASRMRAEIEKTIHGKNTLGGVLEIVALNLPVGLGSFVQWDKRLEARLAMAVMSVQAIKGVEVGDAFANTKIPGTQAHDPINLQHSVLQRSTNRAGGTEGGISNGQPVVIRAAMKPIATTLTPQQTVDLAAGKNAPTRYERSDFCPVPRAVPILEAMVAFILADALIEKLGGDSMDEMMPRFAALRKATLEDLQMDGVPHIFGNRKTDTNMHIFLYGPPGTGKSTIGEILAHNLKLSFVDLDALIEETVNLSIAQIMEQQGEPAFRDLETSTLKEIVEYASVVTPHVIALGGGTLLRQENRSLAETHGTIVLLTAELPTLMERLKDDSGKRPLLAGNLQERLTSLLEQRKEHYASFPFQIQLDGMTAEQCVAQIQTRLGRFHLSAMGEYDVVVGRVEQIASHPFALQNPVIVTDENVAKFHLEKIQSVLRSSGHDPKSIVLPAGEDHKNLNTVSRLWNAFLENGLDRRSTVIALGGGVIGDMAGFAAATYMRGVQWICIPTTLLSMVDASLGGKTGFDLPQGKNLVGSFYPPKLVLADSQLLNTLPQRELISGMAEVVKHGIISDPELFDLCACGWDWVRNNLEQVVKRAMAVKIKVIEEDPFEKGVRAALNLGHTVGHAVELVSKFELRHGEAVAIGMAAEARFAERIGVAEPGLSDTITGLLFEYGLPVNIPGDLPRDEILRAMRMDKKKNAAKVRFALPVAIGKVELVEVTDLESVLQE